jgi:hypothetical protein
MYIAWDHINANCILIYSMCFACTPYSLVLILRIHTYLEIKGAHFFSDLRNYFWQSFYVQIGVLQFVSGVQIYTKSNVTTLYVANLY